MSRGDVGEEEVKTRWMRKSRDATGCGALKKGGSDEDEEEEEEKPETSR